MSVCLGVVLLAEREGALDQDRLLTYVEPVQRECLARPQAGVGEHAQEHCVAWTCGGSHSFDDDRGGGPYLFASRQRRLSDGACRVALQVSVLKRSLQDPAEQGGGVVDCYRPAAGCCFGLTGQKLPSRVRHRLPRTIRRVIGLECVVGGFCSGDPGGGAATTGR
jgi:hypothetical protein